jgi:hypothetical protein
MSADAEVEAWVDLDENAATITRRREIGELFDANGELRLWADSDGWQGYRREQESDGVVYYFVDTARMQEDWTREVRVGEDAVRAAVVAHIADRDAGGVGRFGRGCSP